jgi:predicted transcriptional regulator
VKSAQTRQRKKAVITLNHAPAAEETALMKDVKNAVPELARELPKECTWDEVLQQVFVRQKIDSGLKDEEAGRTIDHDEVFREFSNDDHPVD